MNWSDDFPRLNTGNHRITSPRAVDDNCVAWAADDREHWWQPGVFWPIPNWPESDYGIGALEQIFLERGFVDCDLDATAEPGWCRVDLLMTNLKIIIRTVSSRFIYAI